MNSFKKLITAATLLTMVATCKIACISSSINTITEAEAKVYIGNLVDELFKPNQGNATVIEFKRKAAAEVLNSDYYIWHALFHKGQKIYEPTSLKDKTYNKVLFFIESEAKKRASVIIKDFHVYSYFIESTIISSVVRIIMDRANNLIYCYVEEGRLASYVGSDLEAQIKNLIKNEIEANPVKLKPQDLTPTPCHHNIIYLPAQIYEDVRCCICLEDFNSTTVKKIFLECGHDICIKCLAKLYETNKEKTACPKCRRPVRTGFIKYNANILWAPSAPEEKPAEPQHLYPSAECCVCLEPFSMGPFSTRIFLECGHNICTGCLGKIHEEHKENSKCPLCRKEISTTFIQSNADTIWRSPAPEPLKDNDLEWVLSIPRPIPMRNP